MEDRQCSAGAAERAPSGNEESQNADVYSGDVNELEVLLPEAHGQPSPVLINSWHSLTITAGQHAHLPLLEAADCIVVEKP